MLSMLGHYYRRFFGRYEIDDPRPVAAAHPYTFFVPAPAEIDRLRPGHVAKLMFRGLPEGNVERMWVQIERQEPNVWVGKLDNIPLDLPQLKLGNTIRFQPWQIIQISGDEVGGETVDREYWERCLVDPLILSGEARVLCLKRAEPEPDEGDKYPDSGWRFYGREVALPNGETNSELEMEYLAMGVVLNKDDSWLHLIDEPVGSAFRRNANTGEFESAVFE